MKYTTEALKKTLLSLIEEMGEHQERYAKNPGKDFTRQRSLTLPVLVGLILTMGQKSIWKGLLEHFQNRIDTPSASAFIQQRQKLLPCALADAFHTLSLWITVFLLCMFPLAELVAWFFLVNIMALLKSRRIFSLHMLKLTIPAVRELPVQSVQHRWENNQVSYKAFPSSAW